MRSSNPANSCTGTAPSAHVLPQPSHIRCDVSQSYLTQRGHTCSHFSHDRALRYQLDVTLFDRVSASGIAPLLLDTQYRMHPLLAAFPSASFYAGRLRNGVAEREKPPPRGFPWVAGSKGAPVPVAFLQVRPVR